MPHAVDMGAQFAAGLHPLTGDRRDAAPGDDPAAADVPYHTSATAIAARHRARSPS
ncbi:hypothetical protein J2785_001563 [Burkholderia ambifaria]|nr:hypothetical protein [Burkholderia ambifaria]MDR6498419.1 hypothetical protein [Burkholderia ambifaria]